MSEEGPNFYTLVKVVEKDNPLVVKHTSMMNVRSLAASFSIFGSTHVSVSKDGLEIGKSYSVGLFYFLPRTKYCGSPQADQFKMYVVPLL